MSLSKEQKEFIVNHRKSKNIYREAGEKFFMLPAILVEGEFYKGMTNNARVAYAVLSSRMELSKKNGWYDEEGDIYFIYTNDDLMKVLSIGGKATLVKIKKELEELGLLVQKRGKPNTPNKMYLYHPVSSFTDAYTILQKEAIGEKKDEPEEITAKVKSKNYTVRNTKTTVKHDDENSKEFYRKNKELTDYTIFGVAPNVTDALFRAVRDTEKVGWLLGVLFQAKRHVSNYSGRLILLEDFSPKANKELEKVFLRCLKKKETTKELQKADKYLFVALQDFFEKYLNGDFSEGYEEY